MGTSHRKATSLRIASPLLISAILVVSLAACAASADADGSRPVSIGVDVLDSETRRRLDGAAADRLPHYRYIVVAVVEDGETVYTASYGRDRLESRQIYASVSKPVTATVCEPDAPIRPASP